MHSGLVSSSVVIDSCHIRRFVCTDGKDKSRLNSRSKGAVRKKENTNAGENMSIPIETGKNEGSEI